VILNALHQGRRKAQLRNCDDDLRSLSGIEGTDFITIVALDPFERPLQSFDLQLHNSH
jgi:hypothetical protein